MKKKRLSSLLLTGILGLSMLLTGCGQDGSQESQAAGKETSGAAASGEKEQETSGGLEYYGNDVSEHLDMVMYVIGDEPVSADEVETQMNAILEEKLNVTLDINYIPLSDYTTKYQLLLASGEEIDIIYSSGWAYYFEEARKGAYMELTPEMIAQYMPQTDASQDKISYESVKVNGQIFQIPKNSAYANNAVPVLIRGDLREKYGMDPVDSYEDLEAYLQAVADNEEGIFPYAAGTDGVELSIQMYQCKYNMFPANAMGGKYLR